MTRTGIGLYQAWMCVLSAWIVSRYLDDLITLMIILRLS